MRFFVLSCERAIGRETYGFIWFKSGILRGTHRLRATSAAENKNYRNAIKLNIL